jgi:hypothetical protein
MHLLGNINPLNTKLNPFCHLLALLGAHHILHVSRVRVKETKGYQKLKEEALDLTVWRTRFGIGCGSVVRHITE